MATIAPLHAYVGGSFCRFAEQPGVHPAISRQHGVLSLETMHDQPSTRSVQGARLGARVVCGAKRRKNLSDDLKLSDEEFEALDNQLRKEIGEEKYNELIEAAAQVLRHGQAALSTGLDGRRMRLASCCHIRVAGPCARFRRLLAYMPLLT